MIGIGGAIEAGLKILDRVIPDPTERDKAKVRMLELVQSGELEALKADVAVATGQMEINKNEAQNASLFVAGWRPAVGWLCCAGLAYSFFLRPMLGWASGIMDVPVPPALDLGELLALLMGMLGLGGFRTYEKLKGVSRTAINWDDRSASR